MSNYFPIDENLPPELPDDFHLNEEGIPKAHLKKLIRDFRFEAGINTALFIASGALGRKKTWTGGDYGEHWVRVSGVGERRLRITNEQKIVGILHDVVEDSDWEIEDLREMGFSARICNAVLSVTKLPQEKGKYLDSCKRASIDPLGRLVKMRDNDDNMDLTRGTFAAGDKQKFLYHISYCYLDAVDKGDVTPNSSIWDFLRHEPYDKLVSNENIAVIAANTTEAMPSDFRRKFNLAASGSPSPAP